MGKLETAHNVFGLACILGLNYFLLIVSLTTKTWMYPNLAMPPHTVLRFAEWESNPWSGPRTVGRESNHLERAPSPMRAYAWGTLSFWFSVWHATTQLAIQLHRARIQVVRSKREARKRCGPTESNGTPAMDYGHMNVVLKWCMCMVVVGWGIGIIIIIIIIIMFCLSCFLFFFPPLFLLLFFFGVH